MQTLGEHDGGRMRLCQRLAAFALAILFTDALTRMAELAHKTSLFELCKRPAI